MKKFRTLNLAGTIFAVALVGLAGISCNDIDDLSGDSSDIENNGKLDHFFDFATTKSVDVNVDYGMNEQTLFEIYDVNPYVYTANSVYKRSDVQPIGIGLTDANGKYSGSMILPASLQTAYVYTSNITAPRVLLATISGGILNVTADDEIQPAQNAGTRAASRAISEVPSGFIKIADWNSTTGAIAESSKADPLGDEEFASATDLIKAFLKEGSRPTGLIMGDDYKTDLLKNDEAKVTVTYLYGVSASHGLLAYYTYTGATPSAEQIASLKKGIIFANTFDSEYSSNGVLDRNTSVDIPYINEDGTTTHDWPANARIGFVLYNQAFSSTNTSFDLAHPFYSSPCGNSEVTKIGNYGFFNCCSTLSYEYPTGKSHILLGFEDWNSGTLDFNDVVIKVSGVYPTVNVTTTGREITHVTKGILAFEDNWPARGDYDMNDVIVKYTSTDRFQEKTVVKEQDKPISGSTTEITTTYYKKAIENKFEIAWTGANYRNGFGYEIK